MSGSGRRVAETDCCGNLYVCVPETGPGVWARPRGLSGTALLLLAGRLAWAAVASLWTIAGLS